MSSAHKLLIDDRSPRHPGGYRFNGLRPGNRQVLHSRGAAVPILSTRAKNAAPIEVP